MRQTKEGLRILFITSFYPPHVVGGWEQLVRDINERLQARGHTTHVLTSMHGLDSEVYESDVSRSLLLESDLYNYHPSQTLSYWRRRNENMARVKQTIERFQPDIVFVHVMFNLTRAVPWMAEQLLPGRIVYYVANDWPYAPDPHTAYWQAPANRPLHKWLKRLLAPVFLRLITREERRIKLGFQHVICVSQAVKRSLAEHAGIPSSAMQVIYNGVETDLFTPNGRSTEDGNGGLELLYAGSIVEHKGVHTVVEAMAELCAQNTLNGTKLKIVGAGHPDYEARLRRMIAQANLADSVQFRGRVPREQMPHVLQKADVLLLPSIWEEPLSRMMQEGMAAGLVVVGTLTGGSNELLVEGETGLTFPPGDAAALAQRLRELIRQPSLREELAENGRAAVVARFDIRRMIDEIEAYLSAVASDKDVAVRCL